MEPPEGWSKYKWPILICLVGTVLVLGGLFLSKPSTNPTAEAKSIVKSASVSSTTLKVDVSGAINRPGVYEFPINSRVEDAVAKAGGFSAQANTLYISQKLNLSAKLTDGQKLFIPSKSDAQLYSLNQNSVAATSEFAGISSQISINSATLSELDTLSGVGPVTAQKIIDNRPFASLEELISRKVVSASVYAKIKDKISLD